MGSREVVDLEAKLFDVEKRGPVRLACLCGLILSIALSPVSGQDPPRSANDPEVTKLVGEGTTAFQAQNYKAAFKKFQLADELADGTSWDALAGAGSASLQMGKPARAREYAERLVQMEQDPQRKGISLHLLGVSLGRLNKLSESEAALRESLALRPDRPLQTRISLVSVLCRQGRHDEGLAFFDEEGKCAEGSADLHRKEWTAPERFELDGPITEPIRLSGAYPEYPEQDRLARIEGTVVLDSLIGADGSILCVYVLDGPTPDMSCAAAIAVMNWKFKPSTLEGEPVEVYYNLAVRFNLQ